MKLLNHHIPGSIAKKLRFLQQLNNILFGCLPLEYLSHIRVAEFEKNILKLTADSPAWASKVRYQSNNIANTFSAKSGLTVDSIKVTISPVTTEIPSKPTKKPQLSKASAKQCKALAGSIEHPSLRQALLKLSKRTNNH